MNDRHTENHRGITDEQLDSLLNKWADKIITDEDISILTSESMQKIRINEEKKHSNSSLWKWIVSLFDQPIQAVAVAAMIIAMIIGIALANMSDNMQPPAAGNVCEIENIESQNSTAIIANGTDSQPTVIWIFEE